MNIRTKLQLMLVIYFVFGFLMIHFFWLPRFVSAEKEFAYDAEYEYVRILITSITPDLLVSDLAKIHETLSTILKQKKEWKRILLFNEDGYQLFPLESIDTSVEKDQRKINLFIFNDAEIIGSIEVVVDLKNIIENKTGHIYILEISILAGLLILTLFIYFPINIWILRPVRAITFAALQMVKGDYDSRLPAPSRDEIGQLNESFDHMRSDLKSREEALTASERRLAGIINNSVEGIITIDQAGIVKLFNPAAERIFGYTEEEILNQPVTKLMPEPHHSRHDSYLRRYLETGEKKIIGIGREVNGQKKDGTEVPIWLAIGQVQLENELIFIAAISDITDRKEIEIELRNAKEVAEAATQTKSDFLANMSHEIRTPMNAIIGLSHLCLDTDLDLRQRDYVEKIATSSQSLLGIINDILDFSKIEAGKLELEEIPFHYDDVLENLANLVSIRAREKQLDLVFDTDPAIPSTLIGDPLRVGQVLLNLTANAFKFTEKGYISVSSKLEELTDSTAKIRIAVEDTGIGISPEQARNLFESFTQADTSTTRRFGGTGLGLSISQNLVSLMGGKIEIESELDQGSRFSFSLALPQSQENAKVEKDRPLSDELRDLKLLVLEESEVIRDNLITFFGASGIKAEYANSREGALDKMSAVTADEPYQIVLLNWRFANLTSVEFTKYIRKVRGMGDTPIIHMVPERLQEDFSERIVGDLTDGYLSIPFTNSILVNTLVEALSRDNSQTLRTPKSKARRSEAHPGLKGAQVLLVEDNRINQQVAREFLVRAGLNVKTAENGREAVRLAEEHEFEAILMDLQMPEMDGYEATKLIRQNPARKDVPIIAMTAAVMAGDKEKSIDVGMNDHIGKPLNIKNLYGMLAKWISTSKDRELGHQTNEEALERDTGYLPESLPGIDQEAGLASMEGDAELLYMVLGNFYDGHKDDIALLKEAFQKQDGETASRLVHTIKGISGSFGAIELHNVSTDLDTALRQNPDQADPELIRTFSDEMDKVLQGLSASGIIGQPDEESPKSEEEGISDSTLAELDNLEAILKRMDADAIDKVKAMNPRFSDGVAKDLFKTLVRQVNSFDFEVALSTLMELKNRLS